MPTISDAFKLLGPGERALAVFTDGRHLVMRPDGSGESGNWKIGKGQRFERLIIYKRTVSANEIYVADVTGTTDSPERGRSIVNFVNAEAAGTTDRTWWDFADAGANPVRYVRGS